MKELTEEQFKHVIDTFQSTNNTTEFKAVLKTKGLIKEKFELGKWYRDEEGYFCFYKSEDSQYGMLKDGGDWFDECFWMRGYMLNDGWYLATDQEVEDALIKEAKKRGFKEGVKANLKNCDNSFANNVKIKNNNFRYSINYVCLSIDGFIIFKDGKWAEIIEEKKEIVVNGVTYIEK